MSEAEKYLLALKACIPVGQQPQRLLEPISGLPGYELLPGGCKLFWLPVRGAAKVINAK